MPELWSITLGDLLDKMALDYPQNDAVIYPHEGHRFTYSQFRDTVNAAAKGFMAMGIKKGDHVSIWATNVLEWLITQFATAKIGAVLVTVNTAYKAFELEYLLRQSDTSTLVLTNGTKDSCYVEHLLAVAPEITASKIGQIVSNKLPCLKNVIFVGEDTPNGMLNFNELYKIGNNITDEELTARQKETDPHDVINMQYTSGTTGFPKGVMLTHYNIVNDGKAIGDCMLFTHKDRLCIPVPLFHCFGCVLGVMASVTHGTSMIMVDHFNPIKVMQAVEMEHCTALHGVPTMFIAILENSEFKNYNFSSLRTGIMAGSPCPIAVMRQTIELMNMSEITIAFGQTESSPVVTQTRTDDPIELRVTTIGRALPHMEVKIIDIETGKDAPFNTPGEIVTRGYQVMKGYYNMPEATAQAIDENKWLHTGDIGTMDENGYFKITGRLKDMIIRGGENIYPREIEEFLYTHPMVKDVQVVGIPDKKYGEEVIAYLILREGMTADENEIIQFVRDGLSKYKAPRYIRFIDGFPTTASGKIQKYILRDMAIKDMGLEDAASIETA